jgi:glycine/serine hydroxymethyltransferase
MKQIAGWSAEVLEHVDDEATARKVRQEIAAFTERFPLYAQRLEAAEAAMAGRSTR